MLIPEIKQGRTFALSIKRTAADKVTAVDWPTGTLRSQVRNKHSGALIETMTVDDANRLAADGGVVVLRLTDEQTEAITFLGTGWCDVESDASGVLGTAVPAFDISVTNVPTERSA